MLTRSPVFNEVLEKWLQEEWITRACPKCGRTGSHLVGASVWRDGTVTPLCICGFGFPRDIEMQQGDDGVWSGKDLQDSSEKGLTLNKH